MMAQLGIDACRDGESFSAWFRLLNRLAQFAIAAHDGRIVRQPFASRLEPGWTTSDIVLVVIGTASILFDGRTTLTLGSLGRSLVVEPPDEPVPGAVDASGSSTR